MEQYLSRAIHRCVHHKERNLEFRRIEEEMLPRRKEILADIRAISGV